MSDLIQTTESKVGRPTIDRKGQPSTDVFSFRVTPEQYQLLEDLGSTARWRKFNTMVAAAYDLADNPQKSIKLRGKKTELDGDLLLYLFNAAFFGDLLDGDFEP